MNPSHSKATYGDHFVRYLSLSVHSFVWLSNFTFKDIMCHTFPSKLMH